MGYIEEQIAHVERVITVKNELGKDASFEEGLIAEWKDWLPGGSKRHLWIAYSHSGNRLKVKA